jgi:hypothetical protein
MIWESSDWKKPLLKLSKQINKWKEKCLSDKDLVNIEKTILIAFYSIRKLVDARKLSNTTQEMKINIFSYPNVKNVTLMNWHKIDELYNLEEENPKQCDLSFIYNQLIHSYVFMIDDNPKGGFNGIFFSSDSQRNKKVFKISADELIRILDTVGNDYSSSSRLEFNEVKQDYDVFKP